MQRPPSFAIYSEAVDEVDRWATNFHLCFSKVSFPGIILPPFVMSYFAYFVTNLGEDAFHLPSLAWYVCSAVECILLYRIFHFFRLPFEWRTPFGYLIACSIQFPCVYFHMMVAACSLNFLIGSCRILMSFAKDIKNDLYFLNKNSETNLNRVQLKVKLSEFIEFHAKIKQLRT